MLPLIYLGAGLAALYATNKLSEREQIKQGFVGVFPGDSYQPVQPQEGAIVCCGIYEVLDHSGIWLDDGIVEMKGNGLVRCVSPSRFIDQRSGEHIFVACDGSGQVLIDQDAASRAANRIFTVEDYHLLKNNCHRFVAEALLNKKRLLTSFAELNALLSTHFKTRVHWHLAAI